MTIETAVGLGALVSVIVGLIKKIPGFPDGQAGIVAVALNIISYALLQFGGVLGWNLNQLDKGFGILAQLASMTTPVIVSIVSSIVTHKATREAVPNGWLSFLKKS